MTKRLPAMLVFVLYGFIVKAQLPVLKSAVDETERTPFYNEFAGKYDFMISHHYTGGWSNAEFYYNILAFKGNKRFKILYSCGKDFGKGQPDAQIKIERISKKRADSVLTVFNENKFWDLSNDSMAITTQLYYDTYIHKISKNRIYISDGLTDVFEIILKDAFVVKFAYEPEAYFKHLPKIRQRGRFINAKRAFLELFRELYPHYFRR